jgi:cholera toxin transcriptional activator
MWSPPNGQQRLSFGPFQADVSSGELYKLGRRVQLQDQPFRVLAMLLARPGEVVTREEVRKELWPDGTFIDFDEGLDTALKKLRHALGDSAQNPNFIETIPRRGYRLIAAVKTEHTSTNEAGSAATGGTSAAPSVPKRFADRRGDCGRVGPSSEDPCCTA